MLDKYTLTELLTMLADLKFRMRECLEECKYMKVHELSFEAINIDKEINKRMNL